MEEWRERGGDEVPCALLGYSSLAVPPAVVASPAPAPTGQPLLLEQLCGVSTLPSDSQPEVVGASGLGEMWYLISFGFCIFPLLI